ncbi:MAG: acyltransferase domain-containing protein, partial [Candidatus Electryoneaceae bacterium]|nr:acyltransferase domain-containing protein [Candidatus Electryoneaceae bacterium]
GLSSFGFSGTNVHVILQEPPAPVEPVQLVGSEGSQVERLHHTIAISAPNDQALIESVQKHSEFIETTTDEQFADYCYSTNTGRTHFRQRKAFHAPTRSELIAKLDKWSTSPRITKPVTKRKKICFIFSAQGSQYKGAGRGLWEHHPDFRNNLLKFDELFYPYIDEKITDLLFSDDKDPSLIDETRYTQPVMFAVGYSLAQLWMDWGIYPDMLIGHSSGEVIAAAVANVFGLEDAVAIVAKRGELMQTLPDNGCMVAINLGLEKVQQLVAPYSEAVSVAVVNAPDSITISGEKEPIDEIVAQLEREEVKFKVLKIFLSSILR